MKRTLALALLIALAIVPVLSVTEAWARAGGGTSSGSRGSACFTRLLTLSAAVSTSAPISNVTWISTVPFEVEVELM